MAWVCQGRLGGSRRRVWKREGAQMPGAKRFLHQYLHNRSIEPGTGVAFASFVYLGIKDRGYFVFWFPINDDRGVRNGVPTREGIRSCRLDHGDMENWVDRTHALW